MKLLFLRPFSKSDTNYLTTNLSNKYEIILPKKYSQEELESLIGDVDVCIGNELSDSLLKKGVNIKLFQNLGAGVDKLDLSSFKNRNIIIGNSHTNAKYVAEYAISLMFSIIKKTHHHDRLMRSGKWFKPSGSKNDENYLSDTIIGKRIGIIGFGNIGKNIVKMLSGFDNNFFVFNSNIENINKKNNQIKNIQFFDLEFILSNSNILFLTLPLTRNTRSLISNNEFEIIDKSTFIINVSRAEIIDKHSLYNSLKKGKIKGAAIDVWYDDVLINDEKQYPSSEYPFHKLNNIVLSPYRAGYINNQSPHLDGVIDNLLMFEKYGKVNNKVDYYKGY